MLIADYYVGKEIFITGGTGFIGKALIEKLLRSCSAIDRIYVLIRPKKGKTVDERLQNILDNGLFDRVRKEQPNVLQKVVAIAGDCVQLGLGISPEDLERLKNVNIIFHSAASVRFDDSLRDAILLNTRGTYELVKLALNMPHLEVFTHISTTYCNPQYSVVEEKVYPPIADWRTTIKMAETYNTDILNILNMKYSNYQPNTYTFTKSLSEQIIEEFQDRLPVIIVRPSIVVSSIVEPEPGWVDNFNGPIGMLVACGIGIMRTNYGDPNIISDFVPVDVVVRSLLIATFVKANNVMAGTEAGKKISVYNCATASISPISTGKLIDLGKRLIHVNPFEKTLWYPEGSITRCYFWNLIRFVTLHLFMALMVDFILICANKKPFLLRLQRRIYAANLALHVFLTTTWHFENYNMTGLHDIIDKSDHETFGFMQFSDLNHDEFFTHGIRGAKKFLFHENPDASSGAHLRMRIFGIAHYLFQIIGAFIILRFIYMKIFA